MPIIGALKEKSLHAALKAFYAQPGDHVEQPVEDYVIDIVREDQLIEIQTGNFNSIRSKLANLLPLHPILVVYPVIAEKWIVKIDNHGEVLQRRRSPKQGHWLEIFRELTSIASYVPDSNFSLEAVLLKGEEIWINDGEGSWRRKRWSIHDRRLIEIVEIRRFDRPQTYLQFLPEELHESFTSLDIADLLNQPRWLAGKMLYCLRQMGVIRSVGKRGNAILYERTTGKVAA